MLVGYEGWSSRLFNFVKALLAFSGGGRVKGLRGFVKGLRGFMKGLRGFVKMLRGFLKEPLASRKVLQSS